MKNPLAGIKFKQILFEHGEKIVLGGAGLLVVIALLFGTQWSRYDGDPRKLEEEANTAGRTIEGKEWPKDEERQFIASTQGQAAPQARVQRMIEDLPLEDPRFAWDKQSPISWKPIPPQQPVSEPEWLALVAPIADAGRITIDVPLAAPESAGTTTADSEVTGDSLTPSRRGDDAETRSVSAFQRRTDGGGAAGGLGAPGGPDGGLGGAVRPGSGLGGGRLQGFTQGPGAGLPMNNGAGAFGQADEGVGQPASGYPTHYTAVRLLFRAKEQLKAILKARGQASGQNAEELLSIYDFEIERQQTVSGPEQWSAWEKFELGSTLRLLDLVSAYEDEIMSPAVVDPTITMPLPIPKYGTWGPDSAHASHPLLEKYKLDSKNQKILAVATGELKSRLNTGPGGRDRGFGFQAGVGRGGDGFGGELEEKKGWSTRIESFRDVAGAALKDRKDALDVNEKIRTELENEFGAGVGVNLQQLTLMGEYFLFRFVDFDLESGRAYRYRARVKLLNPNFDLPLDRVTHPTVAEGEFRWTEWSPPTPPVIIEDDVEYYVEKVERGTGQRSDTATMRLHVWSEALGTWVGKKVTVEPGEPVGGTAALETDIVDLVNDKYETSKVRFETDDVLADVLTTPSLPRDDEFHSKYLTIPRTGLDIRSPTAVLDKTGNLAVLDPIASDRKRRAADKRLEEQMEGFAWLKEIAADGAGLETGGALDGGLDIYGDGGSGAGAGTTDPRGARSARRRQRPTNPLRIGGEVERQLPKPGSSGSNPGFSRFDE